jgi:TRAP-type mannitol/chloroaromatic compound transport system permease small subunit
VTALLGFTRLIDRLNERVGNFVYWLLLGSVLISAVNAMVRKALNMSSNAALEIQWYLFAAVFLLGAGYTLLHDAHVRIDVLSNRFSRRTQVWIDTIGIVVFLLPLCAAIIWLSWPIAARAYESGEMSSNAGGLIRWPAYVLLPLGFALLMAQGVSELIKQAAFLTGAGPDPHPKGASRTEEEMLLDEVRLRQAEAPNPESGR